MKKTRAIISILALLMLVVGAAATASADALGDGYEMGGIQIGYWLIGIAIIIGILIFMNVLAKKKFTTPAIALIILGALLLIPFTAPTATIADTDTDCCPFTLTASALTSGTDYISTATWNSNTKTLTVPLTVADSSDGNLTGHITGLNITVNPTCSGSLSTQIEVFTFSSDYLMKYGGEYILDEDSTGYNAIWTTTSGTDYYDTTVKVTADDTGWANITYTFVNETSGSWVNELDQIGDTLTWYVLVSNGCQTERITIHAIVVDYTA